MLLREACGYERLFFVTIRYEFDNWPHRIVHSVQKRTPEDSVVSIVYLFLYSSNET